MGLGRVQLRKISPYIIELQLFTANSQSRIHANLFRKTECCWLRGIVAEVEIEQREIEQRVKTEALSRVEAAERIDAA